MHKDEKLILRLFGIHKILNLLTLKISHDPYCEQKHQQQHNNQVQVATVCIFNLWQKYSIEIRKLNPKTKTKKKPFFDVVEKCPSLFARHIIYLTI